MIFPPFWGTSKLDVKMLLIILRDFPPKKIVHEVWGPVSYFMTPAVQAGFFLSKSDGEATSVTLAGMNS